MCVCACVCLRAYICVCSVQCAVCVCMRACVYACTRTRVCIPVIHRENHGSVDAHTCRATCRSFSQIFWDHWMDGACGCERVCVPAPMVPAEYRAASLSGDLCSHYIHKHLRIRTHIHTHTYTHKHTHTQTNTH